MNRSPRIAALVAVGLLLLGGCGDDETAGPAGGVDAGDAPRVQVQGAWARTSPMMAANGAVYLQLTASGDDRLVGAAVDPGVAATAEVHETAMDPGSGEMAMRETDAIELPAGQTVVLEPGGHHIMLLDLVEPLEVGASVEVTLELELAGEVTVTAEVRDTADGMHGG